MNRFGRFLRRFSARRRRAIAVGTAIALIATTAWAGHEMAVYPSYYPHEIVIRTMPAEAAATALRDRKLQAYLGAVPEFSGAAPASVGAVESLGSFVILRTNPAKDEPAACASTTALAGALLDPAGFVFHPYPVTPFHGDYLYHVDRADAATARFREAASEVPARLKVKADGALAKLIRPELRADGPDWDAAIEEVDAAGLLGRSMTAIDGWLGPAGVKAGWYQAEQMLTDGLGNEARNHAESTARRLETGAYRDTVERINLERDLVATLAGNCRRTVVGYTLKRQYFSDEFTDGIENVGFDAIAGLASPMFIRTVKLKNFPWNGWLALGTATPPTAAWNPIAGFGDEFGQLLWSAVGDPALLPAPYDAGWMLNRVADVRSNAGP